MCACVRLLLLLLGSIGLVLVFVFLPPSLPPSVSPSWLFIARQDSWTALAGRLFPTTSGEESTQADLEAVVSRDANMINTLVEIGVSPIDEYNTELLDNVHPANWQDAEPDGVRFLQRQLA